MMWGCVTVGCAELAVGAEVPSSEVTTVDIPRQWCIDCRIFRILLKVDIHKSHAERKQNKTEQVSFCLFQLFVSIPIQCQP